VRAAPLTLLLVIAHGGITHAEPDPAVAAAGEANLEPTERHQGLSFALALGGGFTLGFGIDDSVGRGGAGSLRLGQAATPRSAITLEVAAAALFHAVKTTSGETTTRTNNDSNLLVGAQYFLGPGLWLRAAVGFGVYRARSVGPSADDVTLFGPSGVVGAGVDLVRRHRTAIGFELMSIGMLNREGLLSSNGFMLNLSVD